MSICQFLFYRDLTETKKNLIDTEQELKQAVDNASESCQLFAQVEELKIKLRQTEEANVKLVVSCYYSTLNDHLNMHICVPVSFYL